MKFNKFGLIAILLALTVGCASVPPQLPIQLSKANLPSNTSITIAATEVVEPSMMYPGAGCLLCLGVAAASNSGLSTHVKTLPNDDLKSLQAELSSALQNKGFTVKSISEPFISKGLKKATSELSNAARKDYTALKDQYNTSHLLLIQFDRIGMNRNYSNYIATSAPYVAISGTVFLVNLETNTYDWYLPFTENNHPEGQWKEPEDYPNLSNAYYESVERIRDNVLSAVEAL